MIKIFFLFTIVFLWALQFYKPVITRKPRKHYIIEQIGAAILFGTLVLIVIFGV